MNTINPNVREVFFPEAMRAKLFPAKKRVAAYARVSSPKDAMLHSLAAQVSYYTRLIQGNGSWEFVRVYADEAVTGTKANRAEFQQMLADCRAGKIDMIITKAVSRFARNTLTLLTMTRELTAMNIDVYFEKENIHSMNSEGELMLTLMGSVAEEESRAASEEAQRNIRRKFHRGIPNTMVMLGYRFKDGRYRIVEDEAEIVKMIFADYLDGMGRSSIVRKLTDMGVKTPRGDTSWHESEISRILRNEKYSGDMLLQKVFTPNYLTKRRVVNNGEVDKIEVSHSHEPIIPKEMFDMVQKELQFRADYYHASKDAPKVYPYTGKIVCGVCGRTYHRKTTHAGTKYEKIMWLCPTYDSKGKSKCDSKRIPESVLAEIKDEIKEIIVTAPNEFRVTLASGTTFSKQWEWKSKKESWTDDMKQAARERQFLCIEERLQNG